MELRHLRYFIAAAEEEHFGRASDRLCVTRPAVSQIIADLEDEIGVALFDRQAHKVKLTAAGAALLPRLHTMMADLQQALVLTKRVGQGKSGVLVLGYGSLSLQHPIFKAAVKRFRDAYPDVTLSLVEMPTTEQMKALVEGRIHAGFMHFGPNGGARRKSRKENHVPTSGNAVDHWLIQSGQLGVVVYKDHPLAQKASVSLAELANERFVVVPHSSVSPGYGPLYALCQEAGFEPTIVQEVGSVATQLNLISVGIGIGLSVMGKNFSYPASLVVLKLRGVKYETSFQLRWKSEQVEPVLQQFIDVVQQLTDDE